MFQHCGQKSTCKNITILFKFPFIISPALQHHLNVSNNVLAYDGLPAACLQESSELVEVGVGLMQARVGLVKEGFEGLQSHWTGHPFGSLCRPAEPSGVCRPRPHLHTFRHSCESPSHVDQNVFGKAAADIGLWFCWLRTLW